MSNSALEESLLGVLLTDFSDGGKKPRTANNAFDRADCLVDLKVAKHFDVKLKRFVCDLLARVSGLENRYEFFGLANQTQCQ